MLRTFLTASIFTSWIQSGLEYVGFDEARAWIAPLFLVILLIPIIAISLLVFIAFSTVPAVVDSVAKQKVYEGIMRIKGGSFVGSFQEKEKTHLLILRSCISERTLRSQLSRNRKPDLEWCLLWWCWLLS